MTKNATSCCKLTASSVAAGDSRQSVDDLKRQYESTEDAREAVRRAMSEIPKRPPGHDDLCVWWDNVGKVDDDYACTCGASDLARYHEHAVAVAAVEALRSIKYAVGVGDTAAASIADCMDHMRAAACETLRRIEESRWAP